MKIKIVDCCLTTDGSYIFFSWPFKNDSTNRYWFVFHLPSFIINIVNDTQWKQHVMINKVKEKMNSMMPKEQHVSEEEHINIRWITGKEFRRSATKLFKKGMKAAVNTQKQKKLESSVEVQ